MPELPEVENFARAVHDKFAGRVLKKVVFHRPDIRFPLDQKLLRKRMAKGSTLVSVSRVAKQMKLSFESGEVFVSLGMSGHFSPSKASELIKHEHVTWHFEGGGDTLAYVDPRRFGFLALEEPAQSANPLVPKEVSRALRNLTEKNSIKKIRDVMLDQKVMGGVGNIYACEACFLAGVHPLLPVNLLSVKHANLVAVHLAKILETAIKKGGSSVSTYRSFSGDKGNFQDLHQVYGRAGQECLKRGCEGIIEREVSGGRGVFFCPNCQGA